MRKYGSATSSNLDDERASVTSGHHKCATRGAGRFGCNIITGPASSVADNGVPTIKGDTRALDRKIKWSRNEAAMQRMRSRPAPLSIPRILGEAARVLLSNMRIESKP